MNKSDSERIAAVLENKGYKPIKAVFPAEALASADLIVVNMCSVRQSAVNRVYGLVQKFKKLKEKNPKLTTILTGCILKKDKEKFAKYFDYILDIKDLLKWPKIKPRYSNNFSAFVPIMTGCNNFCSYCVVPYTRGKEISRSAIEIIKEVKNLVNRGYKEIILLGQNVNSYCSKLINFPKLLKMLEKIPGNFEISFMTSHPKDLSDELIETIATSKKIKKEIHLPVQSGDDEILKKMNRGYTVKKYTALIKKIRERIPEVKISSDIIVGFPGETKKQFANTLTLVKKLEFSKMYVSKYSPRQGTVAFNLKDNISQEEKKQRQKILNELIVNCRRTLL